MTHGTHGPQWIADEIRKAEKMTEYRPNPETPDYFGTGPKPETNKIDTSPEAVERLAKTAELFARAMKAWQHKTQKHNEDVRDTLRALSARVTEYEVRLRELEQRNVALGEAVAYAEQRAATLEAKLAKAVTVQHAASVILADRWGGYGNIKARQAMWDFVFKQHNRHMLPQSHYDGVLQAGLRALAEIQTETKENDT